MSEKLTTARLRELNRVFINKRSQTRAGFLNRKAGLTEWVWKLRDGTTIGNSEIHPDFWYDQVQGAKIIGERITEAGRTALSRSTGGE